MVSIFLIGVTVVAAAPHELIGFCLKSESSLCSSASLINPPSGGSLLVLTLTKEDIFQNKSLLGTPEVCHGKTGIKVTETDKKVISASVEEQVYTECTGPCSTVTAVGLPWTGEIRMTTVLAAETYEMFLTQFHVVLSGCTFGVKCEFGVPTGGGLTLKGGNGASGAFLKAEKAVLAYQSGSGEFICGATAERTAKCDADSIHLRDSKGVDVGLHEGWWFTLLGE
jgi:hypothetical protein